VTKNSVKLNGKKAGSVSLEIAAKIKLARKESGITQTELGAALGVTFQQIQKYESAASRIAPDRLQLLAEAVGKPISYFFSDVPASDPGTDDALLAVVEKWMISSPAARHILAALPTLSSSDMDLTASFVERLAAR
jgi:transcriptional regulator with XRE-family HTH domain